MNFNETKYRKCINHLVSLKASIIIGYIIIFALFGTGISFPIMNEFFYDEFYILGIGAGIGAIIGLLIGLSATWKIEMKIQESFWRIDILKELQNQTSIANKNIPVAKTVVAIENKSSQPEEKKEESK